MLKTKSVEFFAFQGGLTDLLIAEREVVLTYVLRLLSETKLLDRLAFKGGTCLRKVFLGSNGRFSMDLDFTAKVNLDPEDAVLDLMEALNREFHGITFHLDKKWRITQGGLSFAVEPSYIHEWNDSGSFQLQVSCRESPTLDVDTKPLVRQPYFGDLEFDPPMTSCLDIHEILAEKIRAAYQRAKVRDLYDLYCFSGKPFSRPLVRKLAVVKLWQANDPLDPQVLFERLRQGPHDWADIESLIGRRGTVDERDIIETTVDAYSFLRELTEDEEDLVRDSSSHRLRSLHKSITDTCRELRAASPPLPPDFT